MIITIETYDNSYLRLHWREFYNAEHNTFTKDLAWNRHDFLGCPATTDVVVVRDGDVLVAYGIAYPRKRHNDYYIANVAVVKGYQGKGLGRKVMNELVSTCRKKGLYGIALYTINPVMIQLCESLGFIKIRKIKNYANSQDALLMRLSLSRT